MHAAKFRIGLIQMACSVDPNENVAKAEWRIREAAGRGAQIICLQELFRSQYFCREEDARLFDLAEPIPGPSTESLCRLADELGVVIVGSLFERRTAGVYHNTAVIIDADGELLGLYRKMHIPDDPLYFEKFYFTPGDLGFRSFDTRFGRVAALVCWDQWYPEAARLAALDRRAGAVLPDGHRLASRRRRRNSARRSTTPGAPSSARTPSPTAIYVAAVNRVGYEGPPEHGLEFWGASFVADPFGQVVAEASARPGRDPDRGMRSAAYRGGAPQLALPARPPHRRVRRDHAARDRLMPETPRALGFRMPAEWEPHEATWIAWPHNRDDWPGRFAPIPWVYAEIVRKLARVERVRILVEDGGAEAGRAPHSAQGGRESGCGRVLPCADRSRAGLATTARCS